MERLAIPDYGAQWVMVRTGPDLDRPGIEPCSIPDLRAPNLVLHEETLVRPISEQDDDALLDPDWDELGDHEHG